jgi:regulatory protein
VIEQESEVLKRARAFALGVLARREQSAAELARKLAAKGFDAAVVQTTLDALKSANWQSDLRFVESQSRVAAGKLRGPLRLKRDLIAKGIEPELAKDAIEQIDWMQQARLALKRRFADVDASDRAAWLKRARFLTARGFSESQIRRVLKAAEHDEE